MTGGIRAALFDMDGLLFDSERVGMDVSIEAGAEQGFALDPEVVKLTLGATLIRCQEIYREHYPRMDVVRHKADFIEKMHALARAGKIPLKPGAQKLLAALKARGIPRALASSSGIGTVNTYLQNSPIADAFDALICGNQVTRSKPDPEIFLLAADTLRVPIASCLVLEDSLNGIKAGRASGARVCMVPDIVPYSDELKSYVDIAVPSLADVIPLLDA